MRVDPWPYRDCSKSKYFCLYFKSLSMYICVSVVEMEQILRHNSKNLGTTQYKKTFPSKGMSLCAYMCTGMHIVAELGSNCRSSILPLKNLQISCKVQLHRASFCTFKAALSFSVGTNKVVGLCFSNHVV